MERKSVLVLGDEKTWQWHPLSTLEPLLQLLEQKEYEVSVCTDYGSLTAAKLERYPVIINYIDNWEARGTETAEEALLQWLEAGKRMLTIHNGIIVDQAPQLQRCHGAAFSHHDPFCTLTFHLTEAGKQLFWDPGSFTFGDEPYEFNDIPEIKKEIFLEYSREGRSYPAGWRTVYGKGEVWYFCPGHTPAAMADPAYLQLIGQLL